MTSWPSVSVAFWVVTIMLMKSHSYWVRISSRDHSVASDELSLARSRMSLAAVGSRETPLAHVTSRLQRLQEAWAHRCG